MLGHEDYVIDRPWPSFDSGVLERDIVRLAVQVDGKLRGTIEVPVSLSDEAALVEEAKKEPNVARHLDGRKLVRSVVVPGKIISLITAA